MRVPHRLLACLLLLALPAAAHAQSKDVNVYNWTDYIDPAAIAQFQQQTGITVHYDVYDALETLEAKMLAGHSGYDVIVPTNEPTFSRLIRAGALLAFDKAQVPNLANLDPKLMARVASSDPGNKHGGIYLWGSTGLGMIPDRIKKLAPDAPLDSWDVLFKPEYAKRIAACGITMMDSATDVIPSVLHYLGHSPDSTSPADLADVEKALMRIRPYIRNFASGGALEQLATGQTCLVLDYSGDVIQAEARANEAKNGIKVVYVAPKEGAQVAFDMLAIPADAPHPGAALKFIDFLLQPKVMAGITNVTRYPNAVPASLPFIKPEIANDPSIFPTPAQMASFFTIGPVPQSAERPRSRMWARFKAGK
jgi:putrescine transport system substrate-binding protein